MNGGRCVLEHPAASEDVGHASIWRIALVRLIVNHYQLGSTFTFEQWLLGARGVKPITTYQLLFEPISVLIDRVRQLL